MDSKLEKEIREYEEAGISVVATKNGKLEYVTGGINKDNNTCDSCEFLEFRPDPDPDDWFRDGDQKAVCTKMKAAIACGLERPCEMVNIQKPYWCPYFPRELTNKEKEFSSISLENRKEEF